MSKGSLEAVLIYLKNHSERAKITVKKPNLSRLASQLLSVLDS